MANVHVILTAPVPELGRTGDEVRVAAGYARNYLIPRSLAVHSTPSNKRRFEAQLKVRRSIEAKELDEAQKLGRLVEGTVCIISATAGESGRLFGSVTSNDIADVLATKGFTVDRRRILMDENIRELGTYSVAIRIHPEVTATVQVQVIGPDAPDDEDVQDDDAADEGEDQ
ncbi:MAG: 50S ribosomal protein L9 [Candidatus Poribacteria bacterium]|nr:50S ribosomal protein L9 [Candidatus Poribacteria bacterium]